MSMCMCYSVLYCMSCVRLYMVSHSAVGAINYIQDRDITHAHLYYILKHMAPMAHMCAAVTTKEQWFPSTHQICI